MVAQPSASNSILHSDRAFGILLDLYLHLQLFVRQIVWVARVGKLKLIGRTGITLGFGMRVGRIIGLHVAGINVHADAAGCKILCQVALQFSNYHMCLIDR